MRLAYNSFVRGDIHFLKGPHVALIFMGPPGAPMGPGPMGPYFYGPPMGLMGPPWAQAASSYELTGVAHSICEDL